MCSQSEDKGTTTNWCGNGWTGQPAVFERDGRTWVVFGAYDRAVHFVDAATGAATSSRRSSTGDIIKGSVTDRSRRLPARSTSGRATTSSACSRSTAPSPPSCGRSTRTTVSPKLWNDDWDGVALVIDDYLFEGGENSQIHIVKLNRG